jgi:hypothetical protein
MALDRPLRVFLQSEKPAPFHVRKQAALCLTPEADSGLHFGRGAGVGFSLRVLLLDNHSISPAESKNKCRIFKFRIFGSASLPIEPITLIFYNFPR